MHLGTMWAIQALTVACVVSASGYSAEGKPSGEPQLGDATPAPQTAEQEHSNAHSKYDQGMSLVLRYLQDNQDATNAVIANWKVGPIDPRNPIIGMTYLDGLAAAEATFPMANAWYTGSVRRCQF